MGHFAGRTADHAFALSADRGRDPTAQSEQRDRVQLYREEHMAKAIWEGVVIADSSNTVVVEGNHYFPPDSIVAQYFKPSDHTSVCSWKGTASYYSIEVNGRRNENAAWVYRDPYPAASEIKGRLAFWKGVKVQP